MFQRSNALSNVLWPRRGQRPQLQRYPFRVARLSICTQAPWPTSDASPSASASKSSLSPSLSFSLFLSRLLRYIPERSRNKSERNKKKATGQRDSPGGRLLVYRSRCDDAIRETPRVLRTSKIHRNFIFHTSTKTQRYYSLKQTFNDHVIAMTKFSWQTAGTPDKSPFYKSLQLSFSITNI